MTQVCAVYGVRATLLLHICRLVFLHDKVSCVVFTTCALLVTSSQFCPPCPVGCDLPPRRAQPILHRPRVRVPLAARAPLASVRAATGRSQRPVMASVSTPATWREEALRARATSGQRTSRRLLNTIASRCWRTRTRRRKRTSRRCGRRVMQQVLQEAGAVKERPMAPRVRRARLSKMAGQTGGARPTARLPAGATRSDAGRSRRHAAYTFETAREQ